MRKWHLAIKSSIAATIAVVTMSTATMGQIFTKWDFESGTPSGGSATAPFANFVGPSIGTGTITVNGPTPPVNAVPNPYVGPVGQSWYFGGSGSPRAWSVSPFYYVTGTVSHTNPLVPAKSAWVQFATSTAGYQDIVVSWAQRWTSTSPNTVTLQYTTDGATWTDFQSYKQTVNSQFFSYTANLSAITGVNNNPNFAIRLAADVDPDTGLYNGTPGTNVATTGNWRFDDVTFSGNVFGAVGPTPTISAPSKSSTIVGPVTFTVTFDEPVNGFDSANDVNLILNGSAIVDVVQVTGTAGTAGPYTVTLDVFNGLGSVAISIPAGAANAVSNGFASKSSAPSTAVNVVENPFANVTNPSTYFTNGGPVTYTVNFTMPVTGFNNDDFDNNGLPDDLEFEFTGDVNVGSAVITGTDGTTGPYTVTLSNITGNGTVALNVAPSAGSAEGVGNRPSFVTSPFIQVAPTGLAAQWLFDSPDGNSETGVITPVIGSGAAVKGPGVGPASDEWFSGFPNSGIDNNNSGWSTVPLQGIVAPISNTNPLPKSRYVQFNVPTTNYSGIVVSLFLRYSDSAVDTTTFQYTTDGVNWVDAGQFIAPRGASWNALVFDISSVAAADDNPNFAIRFAADINPNTGAYDKASALASENLAPGGAWRFDYVTVSGVASAVPYDKISDLSSLPNGTVVSLSGKGLYLKESTFGYISETDRSSGIRLEGSLSASEGDLVSVVGTVATTAGGEKYLANATATTTGSQNIIPVFANGRNLKTNLINGIFVKAAGVVKAGSISGNSYVIADGADQDGIGVITAGAPAVNEGDFVVIEGAAGFDGSRVIYQK